MSDTEAPVRARRSRRGRAGRQAAGTQTVTPSVPYITRKIPYYEVLDEEGLSLIENNAEIILEEIGIEFRDDEEAFRERRTAKSRSPTRNTAGPGCSQGGRTRPPRLQCTPLPGSDPALPSSFRFRPPARHDGRGSKVSPARAHRCLLP